MHIHVRLGGIAINLNLLNKVIEKYLNELKRRGKYNQKNMKIFILERD
jgi:hypothetical protein